MTMSIDRDSATAGMGPERMALLRACLEQAWSTYEASFRPLLPLCSAVGIANILHELVVHEVRNTFGVVDGVVIHDNIVKGRFLLEIDGTQILQFKKLTKDFLTVNNPTETSLAFDNQQSIDGMPDLPRLTVGYQLGQYGTAIAGMWLAFVIGKECDWYEDLRTGEHSFGFEFPKQDTSAADQERAAKKAAADAAKKLKRKRQTGADDNDGAPPIA